MFRQPWRRDGLIYASDGAMMIRFPAGMDDFWINAPTEPGDIEISSRAQQIFEEAPTGELRPLASVSFEPVIERVTLALWDSDEHDAPDTNVWVARMTEVKIDGVVYDARRLLFARQTLATELHYHANPARTKFDELRMNFSDHGEMLLMPILDKGNSLHWDGKRYWANRL